MPLTVEDEERLKARYVAGRARRTIRPSTSERFDAAYAILAAQRATKVLGAFTRLALVEGKARLSAASGAAEGADPPHARRIRFCRRCGSGMSPTSEGGESGMREPKTAMVLAAGFGKRMRPLSSTTPKPLVEVGGRALIDHCLDGLGAGRRRDAPIVNVHYLADKIEAHLAGRKRPRIVISDERDELLETGGGITQGAAAARRRRRSSCATPIPSGSKACGPTSTG